MEANIMTIMTISSLYIPVENRHNPTFLLKNSYYYIYISIMVIMVIGVIMVIMVGMSHTYNHLFYKSLLRGTDISDMLEVT